MEYTLLKFTALVIFSTVILPILKVYIRLRAKEQKKIVKDTERFEQMKAIKEIYLKERKPYADEARELFHSLCRQGRIHHEDVVLIRKLLEDSMGSYAEKYRDYKFENEYNRLYVYLKDWHIDVSQWEQIINFLNEIYESDDGVIKQN